MEALTKEENQELADKILLPILKIIDRNVPSFNMDAIDETIKNMEDHASSTAAWPFEETMDKAKELEAMNELFISIVEVMKKRLEQMKRVGKMAQAKANKVRLLSELGI